MARGKNKVSGRQMKQLLCHIGGSELQTKNQIYDLSLTYFRSVVGEFVCEDVFFETRLQ